jgi:hypothetical protein
MRYWHWLDQPQKVGFGQYSKCVTQSQQNTQASTKAKIHKIKQAI